MKDKKLGLAINAFEGTEHLYNILREIRDLVDYVVIGLQESSYLGNPIDETDLAEAKKLVEEDHLADKVLMISTDHKEFSRKQETSKRNQLADDLEANGCTHQLIIDSDEYYTHNAFQRARDYVYENDIEISYCRYLNYFGSGRKDDYKTYLVYPFHDGNYVPFIAKIKYRFDWQCKDFPKPSDPTRRYVRPKVYKKDKSGNILYNDKEKKKPIVDHYLVDYYEFPWKDLKMHHFSWIRNDIRKKMRDWSSRVYFNDWYELVDKAADRFERFCNGEKEGEAILLFNTPDNKVDLHNMERQYVFPEADISERAKRVPRDMKVVAINVGHRNWIETVREIVANDDKEYFVLFEDFDTMKDLARRSRDLSMSLSDDSVVVAHDWDSIDIAGNHVDVPRRLVMLSKMSTTRILAPDNNFLELSGLCTPLEIVGLSLQRYYTNIEIKYKQKLLTDREV